MLRLILTLATALGLSQCSKNSVKPNGAQLSQIELKGINWGALPSGSKVDLLILDSTGSAVQNTQFTEASSDNTFTVPRGTQIRTYAAVFNDAQSFDSSSRPVVSDFSNDTKFNFSTEACDFAGPQQAADSAVVTVAIDLYNKECYRVIPPAESDVNVEATTFLVTKRDFAQSGGSVNSCYTHSPNYPSLSLGIKSDAMILKVKANNEITMTTPAANSFKAIIKPGACGDADSSTGAELPFTSNLEIGGAQISQSISGSTILEGLKIQNYRVVLKSRYVFESGSCTDKGEGNEEEALCANLVQEDFN